MGCCVSKSRYDQVCQELEQVRGAQAHQADGFCKVRGQHVRDRNYLFESRTDIATLQTQLFNTSADLVELAHRHDTDVVFTSLPLKTCLAFTATLV